MNISSFSFPTKLAIMAGIVIVGAVSAVAIFANAEVGPEVTTRIENSSHSTITSAQLGSVVHAHVSIATTTSSTTPTGSVDFNLYNNMSCSGSPNVQAGVALQNGTAESAQTSVGASGLSYRVRYNGDANNVPSEGACVSLTPTSASTSIAMTLSSTSVLAGSFVHAVSNLSNATANASGTVAYNVYTNSACTQNAQGAGVKTVTNASVPNSDSRQFSQVGTFYWQAHYSGDVQNAAATSSCAALGVLATSTPQGRIIVDKVTIPGSATTSFSFDARGTGYADFSLTDADAPNNQHLAPGTYRIIEQKTSGWKLSGATCSINGATGAQYVPGSALTLNANDTITCVFTNTQATSTKEGKGDHGKHKGFVGGLPFGIFKKIFNEDFVIPPGIAKRFLGDNFFKNLFGENSESEIEIEIKNDKTKVKAKVKSENSKRGERGKRDRNDD